MAELRGKASDRSGEARPATGLEGWERFGHSIR